MDLGLRVSHDWQLESGSLMTTGAHVGWKREFGDRQIMAHTNFEATNLLGNIPISYSVKSLEPDADNFLGGLNLQKRMTTMKGQTYTLQTGYTLELGKNQENHSATVQFGMKF